MFLFIVRNATFERLLKYWLSGVRETGEPLRFLCCRDAIPQMCAGSVSVIRLTPKSSMVRFPYRFSLNLRLCLCYTRKKGAPEYVRVKCINPPVLTGLFRSFSARFRVPVVLNIFPCCLANVSRPPAVCCALKDFRTVFLTYSDVWALCILPL